jgi:hypothetical protein
MCGFIDKIEGRQVTLSSARQMYRYDSHFVLTDLAEFGPRRASVCMFSAEMSKPMVMLEACGVIFCTDKSRDELRAVVAQKMTA